MLAVLKIEAVQNLMNFNETIIQFRHIGDFTCIKNWIIG